MNATVPVRAARVLVVEDEPLVAMLIEDYLHDLGYEVVGPAARLERGIELARHEAIDFAMLDINLRDKVSFPIADILTERQIPYIFATGTGRMGLDARHERSVVLNKPFDLADLERALGIAELHLV